MLIQIHSETPNPRHIKMASDALGEGKLIVYPTDTLYGLGCDIHNKNSIKEIYHLKKMNRKKPLSFICEDFTHIAEYANVSNFSFKIMKYLAPGPFTFILPATNKVPKLLTTKQKTVGIRIPDNTFAREIVREFKSPIISTTLSTRDGIMYSDPDEIEQQYSHKVDLFFSEGISYSDPSTVLDLTKDEIVVLREGKGDIGVLY